MNAKDIGVLIRLLHMTQDVQCRLGRGFCKKLLVIHYSFMCLMAVTRQSSLWNVKSDEQPDPW